MAQLQLTSGITDVRKSFVLGTMSGAPGVRRNIKPRERIGPVNAWLRCSKSNVSVCYGVAEASIVPGVLHCCVGPI
jgi:hypothetical protein